MNGSESATFAGRWARAVRAVGERPFLVYEDADGRSSEWSYADFDAIVAEVGAGLAARGVTRGTAVHVCLGNSPAFVAAWLATSRLGAVVVPSDPRASARELSVHRSRTRATVGLCSVTNAEVYRRACREAGPDSDTNDVVVVDESDTELAGLRASSRSLVLDGVASPEDRAAVMFTSGTTSAPKGVVVTQANYAFAGDVMAAAAALSCEDRHLVVLPLFHANAQYYSFASAISAGASVALMSSFSASGFLGQAARHRATHASLFAAPMRMILARGAIPVEGVALRHVWFAQNLTSDQYTEISSLLGVRPRQLYGMTETIPAVLSNPALDPAPDAMGVETLGCRVDVLDPDRGLPVPEGEVGEIAVGGRPGVELFASYLDDPDTTAASFRYGWFFTGDLAWRDKEGRVHFAGRRGDVLKVAGENVSTVEVEAVLAEHPSVLEAAVVGETDPIRDEVPIAFVVQAPARPSLDPEELARYCADRLAPAKRPRRIVVVDELPKTSVGKIRKFLLRAPVTQEVSP